MLSSCFQHHHFLLPTVHIYATPPLHETCFHVAVTRTLPLHGEIPGADILGKLKLDALTAKLLHLPICSGDDLRVGVAGGHTLWVNKQCNGLSWSMASEHFEDDFLVMDLGTFDVILGAQWLAQLGRIILDMDQK